MGAAKSAAAGGVGSVGRRVRAEERAAGSPADQQRPPAQHPRCFGPCAPSAPPAPRAWGSAPWTSAPACVFRIAECEGCSACCDRQQRWPSWAARAASGRRPLLAWRSSPASMVPLRSLSNMSKACREGRGACGVRELTDRRGSASAAGSGGGKTLHRAAARLAQPARPRSCRQPPHRSELRQSLAVRRRRRAHLPYSRWGHARGWGLLQRSVRRCTALQAKQQLGNALHRSCTPSAPAIHRCTACSRSSQLLQSGPATRSSTPQVI